MPEPTATVAAQPSAYDEQISPLEEKFEKYRKVSGVFLAPAAFVVTYWLCGDTTLTPQGRTLSAILACVGMMWISEILPLPVTALFGAAMCIVLRVAEAKTVMAYFGDPIIFVFIGSFMIARAMSVHQVDRRMALFFLSIPTIGSTPAGMLAGMGIVTGFLSMWVSNTATTAMMLPIALGMLQAFHKLRVQRGEISGEMNARAWPFATGMMLMVAYSASIGGIGTPVGSPPNLIALGLIRNSLKVDISFFQWMVLMVPMLLLMGVVLFVILYLLHRDPASRRSKVSGDDVLAYIESERRRLGPWTAGQRNTLIAFGVAVTLWVLPGVLALPFFKDISWAADVARWMKVAMPEAVVALVAAILLFMLPTKLIQGEFTLNWHEAQKIDWGTILLFGGGLALGSLMFDTKVAEAMGRGLTSQVQANSVWVLTAAAIALGIVLSEATSNTAAANMVIPVIIAIAQTAKIDPLPPALGACLGASYGFMLPVSTPPNAIAYGSGLVPLSRMMRAGIIFDVIGFFVILAGLRLLYPVLSFG